MFFLFSVCFSRFYYSMILQQINFNENIARENYIIKLSLRPGPDAERFMALNLQINFVGLLGLCVSKYELAYECFYKIIFRNLNGKVFVSRA